MLWSGPARLEATEVFPAAPAGVHAGEPNFATIVVNGEQRDEQVVLVDADDIYVTLAVLRGAGLLVPARFSGRDDEGSVNVRDLAPEIVAALRSSRARPCVWTPRTPLR